MKGSNCHIKGRQKDGEKESQIFKPPFKYRIIRAVGVIVNTLKILVKKNTVQLRQMEYHLPKCLPCPR